MHFHYSKKEHMVSEIYLVFPVNIRYCYSRDSSAGSTYKNKNSSEGSIHKHFSIFIYLKVGT